MERCWWCGDQTSLGTYRLDGTRMMGIAMLPPDRLTLEELESIKLCWGCLEAFAAMVARSEDEYRDHAIGRAQSRGPISVSETVKRLFEELGRDATAG